MPGFLRKLLPVLILGAGVSLAAPPDELHYQEGYRLLKQAEQGLTPADRIAGLQAATEELKAAVAANPNHYLSQALLAQTLFGLARETGDPRLASEARGHFAAAARLPEADWRIFNAYGRFLLYIAQDADTLREARQQFETSLGLARWNNDKSTINNLYGQCLYRLATTAGTDDERRAYLKECIERLESATKQLPAATDPLALRILGSALLESGQAQRALPVLQEALGNAASNPETHYALARVYAALENEPAALNELQTSLQLGLATNLIAQAEQDAFFASMRSQPAFRQLITSGKRADDAGHLLREGWELTQRVDTAPTPSDRLQLLQKATERFAVAAQLQTDSTAIQTTWAQSLARLADEAPTADARREFARQAATHFAAVAKPNWQTYFSWGALLQSAANNFSASDEQPRRLFQEAAGKFELAMKTTRVPSERRMAQRELAASLVTRATLLPPPERSALLDRALALCADLAPSPDESRINAIWGRALILTGQAGNSRMQLRQAIEKFSAALSIEPGNLELLYRLATANALLENRPQAMRHLQACLQSDPSDAYRRMAAEDTDLDSLRSLPEFHELIGRQP